jgi:branched-chain amino acid transport system permease protein
MTDLIQVAIDSASLGFLYAVLAIGIALIFGIMNLMNFAHGELIMIGGYTIFLLDPLPWVAQLAGCLAVVTAAAVLMERLAFRPFRGATAPVLLVTSFAVSFALQALAIVLFGSRAKGVSLPRWLNEPVTLGSVVVSSLSIVTICVGIVLLVALALFLRYTSMGVAMRAAAENFTVARLVGVRSGRVLSGAFAVSGLFAGFSAILLVAQGGTVTPRLGTAAVLIAFVATIVGGLGSLFGAALAGFLLGVLTVVLQVTLPDAAAGFRDAFVYLGVLVVLLVRPQGLIAVRSRVERV